jgi:hypothetical protein
MITPDQRAWIEARAYLPEHLPGYVTAVSPAQADLVDDFIVYRRGETLIFIGYALNGDLGEVKLRRALEECRERFAPSVVSFIASDLPPDLECEVSGGISRDKYYRLDLNRLLPSKKLRSLLKRASRDLRLETVQSWTSEHQQLLDEFLRSQSLDRGARFIFNRLSKYLQSGEPRVFQVRDLEGRLIAFDFADFSAGDYAFYMFNFCTRMGYVPGASDLLLACIIERAQSERKRYLNLGLGINPGVTFFKAKWGAEEFVNYCSCLLVPAGVDAVGDLVDTFLR